MAHSLGVRTGIGVFLALAGTGVAAGDLEVREPWVRLMPTAASAGYFTLHNGTAEAVQLTGASSRTFGKVMLHRTVEEGGQSRMKHVKAITVAPGEDLAFSPGDYHLMLMKPERDLEPGQEVTFTLRFASGAKCQADFMVRPAYARGP